MRCKCDTKWRSRMVSVSKLLWLRKKCAINGIILIAFLLCVPTRIEINELASERNCNEDDDDDIYDYKWMNLGVSYGDVKFLFLFAIVTLNLSIRSLYHSYSSWTVIVPLILRFEEYFTFAFFRVLEFFCLLRRCLAVTFHFHFRQTFDIPIFIYNNNFRGVLAA